MATHHPNLLLIVSDEHRRDAMGCAGHPLVQTPHLDALAARGTRFTNAYTPSPICVPARAAMATGRPVHETGYWDSATPYDGRVPSWMHHLRDGGRPVTSIGKLHFRSGDDDTGIAQEILPMHVVGGLGWTAGLLRHDPPTDFDTGELAAQIGAGETSYTAYDRAITAAAEDWLADRPQGVPWAASVSLVSPHFPLIAPEAFYALYPPQDMDLPIARDHRPDHPELAHLAGFFDYDRHFDTAALRQARAGYYGLVSFLDDCVGRILAALDASGQADDTLILYVSDHGEMLGDLGFWTKQVMYEASAGVPMILAGPGLPKGHEVATATNLLDIAPTTAQIAGLMPDPAWSGQSLIDVAAAPDDPGRVVLSEYHDGGSSTGAFMTRWQNWKYVHYEGLPPQLFDLATDPDELHDLAGNAGSQAALAEGARRLHALCDPGAVNRRCFSDQRARIEALGGEAALRRETVFTYTPAP